MYVTESYIKAIQNNQRKIKIRTLINNKIYDNTLIQSVDYHSSIVSGGSFTVGSTNSATIDIKFVDVITTFEENQEVILFFEIFTHSNNKQDVKMGKFYISEIKVDKNNKFTTIKAVDKMMSLNKPYISEKIYPANIKDVLSEIATLADIQIEKSNLSPGSVDKLEGVTYREAISYIAQLNGSFAVFNREGLLEFRKLNRTSRRITRNNYFLKGLELDEITYKINGMSVDLKNKEKQILVAGNPIGNQVNLINPIMKQNILNSVYSEYKTVRFNPFSLDWQGDPALDLGDWVSVEVGRGEYKNLPILEMKLNYSGGLKSTISADVKGVSSTSYAYKGTVERQIEFLNARIGADGKTIYADTVSPQNPKEGDTWFRPNGAFTDLLIYEDGEWQLKTSTGNVEVLVTTITKDSVIAPKLVAGIAKIIELDASKITTGQLDLERLKQSTINGIREGLVTTERFNQLIIDQNGLRQDIEQRVKTKIDAQTGRLPLIVANEFERRKSEFKGHNLNANLRLEGKYRNKDLRDFNAYLDVYYDGEKVSENVTVKLRYRGAAWGAEDQLNWSDFRNYSLNASGRINGFVFSNGVRNGQALEAECEVIYNNLVTKCVSRLDNVNDGLIGPQGLRGEDGRNGHSLSANLRLEGSYINKNLKGFKAFVDVYFDNAKIAEGYIAKLRFKGAGWRDEDNLEWSEFRAFSFDRTGFFSAFTFSDGIRNGTSFEVECEVTYQNCSTRTYAKLDNISNGNSFTFNLIEHSLKLNKYRTAGVNSTNIFSRYEDSDGNYVIDMKCSGNANRRWAGFTLPLTIKNVTAGEKITALIPYYVFDDVNVDDNLMVEIKKHSTNSSVAYINLDRSVKNQWRIAKQTLTITKSVEFDEGGNAQYPLYFHAVKNGHFKIKKPMIIQGDIDIDEWMPSLTDIKDISLTATARIDGEYRNNKIKDIQLYVKAFVENKELLSEYTCKFRFKGIGAPGSELNEWSEWSTGNLNYSSGQITNFTFANTLRNGKPLQVEIEVTYKHSIYKTSVRLDNINDGKDIVGSNLLVNADLTRPANQNYIKSSNNSTLNIDIENKKLTVTNTSPINLKWRLKTYQDRDSTNEFDNTHLRFTFQAKANKPTYLTAKIDNGEFVDKYRTKVTTDWKWYSIQLTDGKIGYGNWFSLFTQDSCTLELMNCAVFNEGLAKIVEEQITKVKEFESSVDKFYSKVGAVHEILYSNFENICLETSKTKKGTQVLFNLKKSIVANQTYTIVYELPDKFERVLPIIKVLAGSNISSVLYSHTGENIIKLKATSNATSIITLRCDNVDTTFKNVRVYEGDLFDSFASKSSIKSLYTELSQNQSAIKLAATKYENLRTKVDLGEDLCVRYSVRGTTVTVDLKENLGPNIYTVVCSLYKPSRSNTPVAYIRESGAGRTVSEKLNSNLVVIEFMPNQIDINTIHLEGILQDLVVVKIQVYKGAFKWLFKGMQSTFVSELTMRAELSVMHNEISSKVSNDGFGTALIQNAESIRFAWNEISSYFQFEKDAFGKGELSIYGDGESSNKIEKRSSLDENGMHFYRNNVYCGKIGTNTFATNTNLRGIVFDLSNGANYMTWASKDSDSPTANYMMKWTYVRKNMPDFKYGNALYASCDVVLNNNQLIDARLSKSCLVPPEAINGGVTDTLTMIIPTSVDSDGTLNTWITKSLIFKNGVLVRAEW